MKRRNWSLLVLSLALASPLASGLTGCSGDDGKEGAVGPPGARGADGKKGADGDVGATGEAGPRGESGLAGVAGADGAAGAGSVVLTAGCLGPCHGFEGVVEQWKSSTHYATFIANLGGEEVATWTGPQTCGNCHALDAIEQRVAGNVAFSGADGPGAPENGQLNYLSSTTGKIGESTYAGHSSVAAVHCTTCHDSSAVNDPHVTGETYTVGSFPLRVPSGPDDQALLEKSSAPGLVDGTPSGKYGAGNACMWCHKSRKDVTNFISVANNTLTSKHWGPHQGPQADIYTGLGGYHYAGKTYGNSSHQAFENGCINCHMPANDTNQKVGDHSFAAHIDTCTSSGCHSTAKSFDVGGGKTAMTAGIQELRVALNLKGWLTRSEAAPYLPLSPDELADKHLQLDNTMPGSTGLTGDQAGAVYNYLLLARGSAGGVHNPLYVRELIFDSVSSITGSPPATLPVRP